MGLLLRALVPLLVPFVLYVAYRLAQHRGHPAEGHPWFSLAVMGLVLACLSLGVLAVVPGSSALRSYVAARTERGSPQPAGPAASHR